MTTIHPAIQCIKLKKTFGVQNILQEVDLSVESGEVVALVGPNGAGKTTLIKILASLIIPTSGKALISGHDVIKDPIQAKRKIGFVPSEERSFYWRLGGYRRRRSHQTMPCFKARQFR